ncbi:MAG TPA: hypothetical protein ENI08_00400 [Candidatus Dependentiae bacterium]|nr:hypothetical protein [Candidatus Dependentiae bacterium]
MKFSKKEFYLIEYSGCVLTLKQISECIFEGDSIPIVWYNQGLFGVIRKETIKNMVQEVENFKKGGADESQIVINVSWDDVTKIEKDLFLLLLI